MDYNFSSTYFSQTKNFMKQKLFGAAAVVALILAGASCSEQKQSEFNFDSVKLETTVSAKITYDAGVEIDSTNPNGYKIVNAKPAVGKKVFIEIPFAQYSGAAGVQGNQIFETVTDENGVFTITVPTKSTGVNGTLRLEEFTAIHREYVKMENGKPVFKTQMFSYDTPPALAGLNLMPGAYKFPDNNDISYRTQPLDIEDFDESVTIAGSINLAYETGFREGAFKNASNANVEFEIAYVGMANPLTFGTTTDANGNYKIILPMRSLSEGFTINSIQVLGIGDNAFKHWVSDTIAEPEIVKGAYQLAGITAGAPIAFANVIDGITYDLGAKNLIFTPYYNANITNIPAPENWTTDLIGWSAGRGDLGFDETYNKTVKLTGKVYMPYLKEYGVGDYKNERQTIKIKSNWTDPVSGLKPYTDLVIITDENGAFSIDLPVNGDDDLRPFTVELEKKDQPFEFKGSKKDVTLYDGQYGNVINIQEEGTEWYELGDYFFKFTPAVGNTPDEWNANLIGWYRSPVFKKINPDKKVKGQFLYAVETSFGVGEYQAKPFIVTIKATQAGEANRFFAVKPDKDGKIEFDLPLKDELDQPVLSVNDANFPTKEYVHYPFYGKSDTRLIEDIYTEYKKVYEKKDPEWNEEIGIRYYKFAVATAPANLPSTFHKNLVGWYKRVDANNLAYAAQVEASGEAKLAYETGFLAGTWKPAEGLLVNVTVDGDPVQVLTDNAGNFKLQVPIKKEGFDAVLGVGGGANIEFDNFLHYKNATETQLLSGEYAGESVAKDDAKWYELGTVYYTFTPAVAEKPAIWDTYCKFIAGWIPAKNGYKYENAAAVTGTIKVINEKSARVGNYVAFQYLPVLITDDAGQKYVGATDKDGKFSINVLRKYSDDEPAITFDALSTFSSDDFGKFVHYRKVGNPATESLEGNYTYRGKQDDPSDKWNKLGIKYYEFAKTTAATDWNLNLAGWNIYDADQQTEITITAKVMRAIEIWADPAKAVWEDESNNTATLTVDGTPYPVPVKGGEISITLMKKEAPAKVTLTIEPDEYKVASFNHWKTKAQESSLISVKNYYYTSANNVNAENCNKEEGNIYKPAHAAKMILKIDGGHPAPEGWGSYSWNVNNDDKD